MPSKVDKPHSLLACIVCIVCVIIILQLQARSSSHRLEPAVGGGSLALEPLAARAPQPADPLDNGRDAHDLRARHLESVCVCVRERESESESERETETETHLHVCCMHATKHHAQQPSQDLQRHTHAETETVRERSTHTRRDSERERGRGRPSRSRQRRLRRGARSRALAQ